jgi:CO/xanthine dehydrogenase Mo-binding subunit
MNDRAVIGGTDRAIIGACPRRRGDARFVTGHGAYMDNLRFDGIAHAVFLHSPHAHVRINAIGDAVGVTSQNGSASGFRLGHAMRDDRL